VISLPGAVDGLRCHQGDDLALDSLAVQCGFGRVREVGVRDPRDLAVRRQRVSQHVRVLLDAEALGWDGAVTELRDRMVRALQHKGVHVGYWLTHPQPKNPVFRRGGPVAWSPGAVDEPLEPYRPADHAVAQRVLDSSIVLGRAPYPLQVLQQRLREGRRPSAPRRSGPISDRSRRSCGA
jgi:hypothetical protein